MLRTILCSFEDSSIADITVSTLYSNYKGCVRIVSGHPNSILQAVDCPSNSYTETVTVYCGQDIFPQVVEKIALMGAEKIRY